MGNGLAQQWFGQSGGIPFSSSRPPFYSNARLCVFLSLSVSLPLCLLPFLSMCGSVSVSGHIFSPSLCVYLSQFLPFFLSTLLSASFPPSHLPSAALFLSISPSLPPFSPNPVSPSSRPSSICPPLAPPLACPPGPLSCCLFLDEVHFPPAESLSPVRPLPS